MLTLKPNLAKHVFLTWLEEDYNNLQFYCEIYNSSDTKVQFHTRLNSELMYTIIELKPRALYLHNGVEHYRNIVITYIKTGWWILTNTP
jgi:hypothetical protein